MMIWVYLWFFDLFLCLLWVVCFSEKFDFVQDYSWDESFFCFFFRSSLELCLYEFLFISVLQFMQVLFSLFFANDWLDSVLFFQCSWVFLQSNFLSVPLNDWFVSLKGALFYFLFLVFYCLLVMMSSVSAECLINVCHTFIGIYASCVIETEIKRKWWCTRRGQK